jgi:hypothetical protein
VTHVGRTRRVVPALLAMMLGAALFSALPGAPPASATGRPHGGSGWRSWPSAPGRRQVTTTVVDPKEKLKAEAGNAYVPFWPAGRP